MNSFHMNNECPIKQLRIEEEIISGWTEDLTTPVVSVCCITYNHEIYIEDAIKGFLNQVTSFPFEVLIRDDASVDGTADIVKKYEKKYPQIIRGVYETENQFSKGIKPLPSLMPKAKGKYIAICEGDDYWTDPLKLQKQMNVFVKNPKVTICFHSAMEYNLNRKSKKIICNHYKTSQIVSFENVVTGRGGFMPTASLLFKSMHKKKLIEIIHSSPIGDFFIQSYMASLGETYYVNEVMCVYRRNAPGSWTESQNKIEHKINYSFGMVKSIDRFLNYICDTQKQKAIKIVLIFYANNYISYGMTVLNKMRSFLKLLNNINNVTPLEFTLKLLQLRYF